MAELAAVARWNTDHARRLLPGLLVCSMAAMAATFLARQYQAPVMLFALLLGMALNFLSTEPRCAPGIALAGREVLRLGVALLGLRITATQVQALGWEPVAGVVVAVALTIGAGIVLARGLGFSTYFGLLTGGAVAICGASAALALSAALPAHRLKERATLFTVIGVCLLSTLAMLLYPPLAKALQLSPTQAGFFLGGSIHDVAQVVGAGYSLSPATGDAATVVKLLRVAMLVPVITLATLLTRRHDAAAGGPATGPRPPLLPGFVLAFGLLVALNSTGWVPAAALRWGQEASSWLLVAAMVAIGIKTPFKDMAQVGWRPLLLLALETLLLAVVAGAWARQLPP